MPNFSIGNNNYTIQIQTIPHLYSKLKIFENSIDITNSVMDNQLLFNEILGKLSLPKLHHTTPKFLLSKWKDKQNYFHHISINKKNLKLSFNSDMVSNTKKCINNYLHPKFSSLHKYTFNFDNHIIIFEGYFINLIEKYMDAILNYLEIIESGSSNQKIKDIYVNFPMYSG